MNESADSSSSAPISVNNVDSNFDGADNKAHGRVKLVAPQLRVETLREDGQNSGASDLDETFSDRDEQQTTGTSPNQRASPQPEKPYVPPSEELKQKIKDQVEFYFSDANILKDAFLLKHVKRNKQGYVSLKLITSFRKVKSLTKDYRVTAECLRESDKLEINEDCTKVRRLEPLPDYDETTPSRTIIAVNLPKEVPSIEEVAELFGPCGEISLIRVLKPGKAIPPDVKKHMNKHPELANGTCAVVEFEHHDSAKKAVETMTDQSDWRKGLNVTLLSQPKKDNNKKHEHKHRHKQNGGEGGEGDENVDSSSGLTPTHSADDLQHQNKSGGGGKGKKDHRNKKRSTGRLDALAPHDYDTGGSDSESGSWRSQDHRNFSRDSLTPPGGGGGGNGGGAGNRNRFNSPSGSPHNSPRSSPRGSPNMRRRTASHGKSPLAVSNSKLKGGSPCASPEARRKISAPGGTPSSLEASPSPSGSPWIQRRLKAQLEGNVSPLVGNSPIGSPRLRRRLLDLEGVLRQPKGPDGSPGFYGGKGRGAPIKSN